LRLEITLDQRIALRAHIDGMTRQETASYISHHLALAGRGSDTLFSDAITLIHDTSRGLPRTVNNLCVASLIAACAAGHAIADQAAARSAITEVTATP
jgi:type II secretory pathway predicted ATPase ExeA